MVALWACFSVQKFHAYEMTSFVFTLRERTGHLLSSFEIGTNIFPVNEVLYLPRFTSHFGDDVINLEDGNKLNPPKNLFKSFHTADGCFIMVEDNYLKTKDGKEECEEASRNILKS